MRTLLIGLALLRAAACGTAPCDFPVTCVKSCADRTVLSSGQCGCPNGGVVQSACSSDGGP